MYRSTSKKIFLTTLFCALGAFILNIGYQYIFKDISLVMNRQKLLVNAIELSEEIPMTVQPNYESEFEMYEASVISDPLSTNEYQYNGYTTKYDEGYLDANITFDSTIVNDSVFSEHLYQDGKKKADIFQGKTLSYSYGENSLTIYDGGDYNKEYIFDNENRIIEIKKNGNSLKKYEYVNDKLRWAIDVPNGIALEIDTNSNGVATRLRQYIEFAGTYFIDKNINFEEMPANINSEIVYERNYQYNGKDFITTKETKTELRNYTYVNDIIVAETIENKEQQEVKTVNYIFDANFNRIGFIFEEQSFYYIYDASGNVDAILNSEGEIEVHYQYDLLGNITNISDFATNEFLTINSFAFRAKDNWYFDSSTSQFYIGADTIYNCKYNALINGVYPKNYIKDPMNLSIRGDVETTAVHYDTREHLTFDGEVKNIIANDVGGLIQKQGINAVKNILTSTDENEKVSERIDVYTLVSNGEEEKLFENQGYFITNDNATALAETQDLNYRVIEEGEYNIYDGQNLYYPNSGELQFKGHFIYGGKYIRYESLDNSNIIVYHILPKQDTYSEDLGNLKDYDANQYILYFGDGSVHEGFEVVSDMVYEVDWDAIHKEIEASLPNTPGVTYQIEDVQVFYVSEDYINAVAMNSRENLYFNGLTEQQMMEQYGDDWSFVYRDGKIMHHTEVPAENFDWGNFFTKIAIGVGVILIAATVTAVTGGGGAPVVIGCLISTAAKLTAVSAIAGVVAATVDYAMTGDINSSLNTFADGFQFTAVVSSIAAVSGVIPPACFVAGTGIETSIGVKAIENIRPGDVVLSYNEKDQRGEFKKVTRIFEKYTKELIHIRLNNEKITTTLEHPFYVIGKGWIAASRLTINDKLLQSNGKSATIQSLETEKLTTSQKVYNFEVEDNHNYYVGNTKVLVHNSCGGLDAVIQGTTSSNILSSITAGLGTVAGVGAVILAGVIVGDAVSGVLTFPDKINVEDSFEKLKESVKERVAIMEKENPNKEIVIRFGEYDISNYLPTKSDISQNHDEKSGLSVFIVSSQSIVNGSFWKPFMSKFGDGFALAILDNLRTLPLEISFEFKRAGTHVAIRPLEPGKKGFQRTYLVLLTQIREKLGQPIVEPLEISLLNCSQLLMGQFVYFGV